MLGPLRRSPLLALGITLTLALGVGAVGISFGLVRSALFRQPPFPEASRIALLYLVLPEGRERWSWGRFQLLEARQQSFERIANYTNPSFTLSGDGDAELARGELVSPGYFSVLGARVMRGRLFAEREAAPVVLVSQELWRRRWAEDTALLGRPIRVNGVELTVIGVLAPGFHGLSNAAELWVPATLAPQLTYSDYLKTNQNFISVVGRLKPGVSLRAAQAELAVLGAAINHAQPTDASKPDAAASATAVALNTARVDPRVKRSLFVLLGAVLVLHLLACANVTNLLLGRVASRRKESMVRLALGSSEGRLFRHLLGVDLLLTVPGCLLGVLAAWVASSVLTPPTNVWAARSFYGSLAAFDAPSFGAAELGMALVTAVLVSVPPALLRSGRRGWLRSGLVAVEAALAVLLVVTAGLLIESYARMRRVELGVDTRNVLTFWLVPSEARVTPALAPAYVARMLEALHRIPGVVSASVDGGAPLAGTARGLLFGREPVLRHYVGPEQFTTLGIPMLRGRGLTAGDVAGAPKVTVISATAARRFWPGRDPIGQRVWFTGNPAFGSPDSSAEVVGIVGDVMYDPLDRQPNRASFYTSYAQFTYASRMFFVKPVRALAEVRKAVRSVDPDVALQDVRTLDEVAHGSWARTRFEAVLFGGFGAAALLLAASGIFAVLAFAVASRTREFGIRIALGADAFRVVRSALREGLLFPLVGMAVGVGAAVGVTRLLRASLYEVSPLEPRVFGVTLLLLLGAALLACLVPAWRATRADPLEAMRVE